MKTRHAFAMAALAGASILAGSIAGLQGSVQPSPVASTSSDGGSPEPGPSPEDRSGGAGGQAGGAGARAPCPEAARVEGGNVSLEDCQEMEEGLELLPEAVVVYDAEGHMAVRAPGVERQGDSEPVARKLPDGRVGWYVGPGPRSDPASFQPLGESDLGLPVIERRDGTIFVDGIEADQEVQEMLGSTEP